MTPQAASGLAFGFTVVLIAVVAWALDRNALSQKAALFEAALAEKTAQAKYWQAKAEALMDAALARAGAIHQPTMETRTPADRLAVAGMAALTTALGIHEIDSSKRKAG